MERIAHYEIRERLGEGGVGEVYRAFDRNKGLEVALKRLRLSADAELLEREIEGVKIQQEAQLRSSMVAQIREGPAEADGYCYIVMDLIGGPSLEGKADGSAREFPQDRAVLVARRLCEVLVALHATDGGAETIVHGDLKPSNIRFQGVLEKSGSGLCLLDFGLAHRLPAPDEVVKSEFGSIPYASPERLQRGELSIAADLWAVHVMLYEMLTGRRPFAAASEEGIKRRLLEEQGPDPPKPLLGQPLGELLLRNLDPNPSRRMQTADEVLWALNALPRRQGTVSSSTTVRLRGERASVQGPRGAPQSVPPAPAPSASVSSSSSMGRGHPTPTAVPVPRPFGADAGRTRAMPRLGAQDTSPIWPPPRPRRWRRSIGVGSLVLVLLLLVVLQSWAAGQGEAIDEYLAQDSLESICVASRLYLKVRFWDWLGVLSNRGEILESRLQTSIEHVINAQRGAFDVPMERWTEVIDACRLAMKIDGKDAREKARQAYAEGHRTWAESRQRASVGDGVGAQEARSRVVVSLERAASVQPSWSAPYFSLVALQLERPEWTDEAQLERALERAASRIEKWTLNERELLVKGYEKLGQTAERRGRGGEGEQAQVDGFRTARDQFDRAREHCNALGNTAEACRVRIDQHRDRITRLLRRLNYAL